MNETITTTSRRSALAKDECRRDTTAATSQNLIHLLNQSDNFDEGASDPYCTSEEEYLPIAGTKSGVMKTRETLLAADARKEHIEGFERETRSLQLQHTSWFVEQREAVSRGRRPTGVEQPKATDPALGFASQTLPCQ